MSTTVQRPASPPSTPSVRSQRAAQRRNHPLWFLVPALLVLVVFFFLPTLFNFVFALTDWSSFKSSINFVGLDNFMTVLGSGSLVNDLRITLIYGILVAIFQNLFGLILALILERDTRVNRIVRVAFFVPVVMSALAVGYIFQALLKPTGGLNEILGTITGHPVTIAWLGNTTWTLLVVTLIHAWKWMGLSMLIYLAGLKTISPDILEAARIDGASWWQSFRQIRLPLLAPAVTFNVATALLGSMNGFDVVQATTGGGPGGSTELLNIYIFRTFGQGLFAQATAMSLALFIMVTLLAFPVIIILRRRRACPVTALPTLRSSNSLTEPHPARGPKLRLRKLIQPGVALLAAVLLLGVPFWLVLSTAGKTRAEALSPNLSPPTHWQLFQNFATVIDQGRMVPAFFGSLLIMVPSVIGVLLLGSMASWILARRKSRGTAAIYALAISGIVLPPAVVTIVLTLRYIGLDGTVPGMIGVYLGMYLSTVIFFVTGFVRTIPIELEEAARVDGAGPVRVFFTIILPLLGPTLATATILICLYIWNDVFYALFVVGGRLDTLPLNLYQVASASLYLNNWHLIFAYVILMSLPLLITFMVMQRKIISGITSGAVK